MLVAGGYLSRPGGSWPSGTGVGREERESELRFLLARSGGEGP